MDWILRLYRTILVLDVDRRDSFLTNIKNSIVVIQIKLKIYLIISISLA